MWAWAWKFLKRLGRFSPGHTPGDAFFHAANVPLFSGFMHAAAGSYIAPAWRVFDLSFTHYPRRLYTIFLAQAIYLNFFTHHYN